jgi:hypothetical protein
MKYELPDITPLKMVAVHKVTFKRYEKQITAKEWRQLKKKKEFYYYAYQV